MLATNAGLGVHSQKRAPSSIHSAMRRSYHNLAIYVLDSDRVCLHDTTTVDRLAPGGACGHAVDSGSHIVGGGGGNAISSYGLRLMEIDGGTGYWVPRPGASQGVQTGHRQPSGHDHAP